MQCQKGALNGGRRITVVLERGDELEYFFGIPGDLTRHPPIAASLMRSPTPTLRFEDQIRSEAFGVVEYQSGPPSGYGRTHQPRLSERLLMDLERLHARRYDQSVAKAQSRQVGFSADGEQVQIRI